MTPICITKKWYLFQLLVCIQGCWGTPWDIVFCSTRKSLWKQRHRWTTINSWIEPTPLKSCSWRYITQMTTVPAFIILWLVIFKDVFTQASKLYNNLRDIQPPTKSLWTTIAVKESCKFEKVRYSQRTVFLLKTDSKAIWLKELCNTYQTDRYFQKTYYNNVF